MEKMKEEKRGKIMRTGEEYQGTWEKGEREEGNGRPTLCVEGRDVTGQFGL